MSTIVPHTATVARRAAAAALLGLATGLPAPLAAQTVFEPADVPLPRPYPYAILDIQPGAPSVEAQAMFEERMMLRMEPVEVRLRVGSPDGRREVAFAFPQRMATAGVGRAARRSRDPFAAVTTALATDALENRVLRIERSLQQPVGELPQPEALLAQLEDLYGPPSDTLSDARASIWTWAWGGDGPIADLGAQESREMDFDPDGPGGVEPRPMGYLPCDTGVSATKVDYDFAWPRAAPAGPGCTAVFEVTYEGRPDVARVTFALTDWALVRLNRAETDRQIVEMLTGEAPVEPSDLDL